MSEVILHIGPYKGERPEGYGEEEGFQVRTNEQVIKLAISNDQSCCEDWGYFLTEDDTDKFVGAELREVRITDTNRSNRQFSNNWEPWDADNAIHVDDGDVMFVDLLTSEGTLQFVAYNAHNGYYGHEARVESRQVKEEKYL